MERISRLNLKEQWFDYIDEEFKRREEGFWYYNKGIPTYITGTHYMYLQWSKIDVGAPDFRESNRLFFIYSGKHAKLIKDAMECVILKNRRSGFSFMASVLKQLILATISSDARFGILSKTGCRC